ncbi:methyltransferase domain-containing protein [bacterium]|nr:methyltransferase domain-containing protein [bacterium]
MPCREYAVIAPYYDLLFERMNAGLRRIAIKIAKPKRGERTLDAACGTGHLVREFAREGCRAVGVDLSDAMLKVARKRDEPGVEFMRADATHLPFAAGSFDVVTIVLALHEMESMTRERVLRELRRVTAPGGRIVVIDYHDGPFAGFVGKGMHALTFVIERFIGGAHYRNYRGFLAAGALPALLRTAGFPPGKTSALAGGNLAAVRVSFDETGAG